MSKLTIDPKYKQMAFESFCEAIHNDERWANLTEHQKSQMIINESCYSVKNVKTFTGREGYGVTANLYVENKKIGTFLDEGNGGEAYIDYDSWKQLPEHLVDILENKLAKNSLYNDGESDFSCDYDEESFWNELINIAIANKENQAILKRKVCIKRGNVIMTINHKPSQLNDLFKTEFGTITLSEFIKKTNSKDVVLNNLDKETALYEMFLCK